MSHLDAVHGLVALFASRKEEWLSWKFTQDYSLTLLGSAENPCIRRKSSFLHIEWTTNDGVEKKVSLNDADKSSWELFKLSLGFQAQDNNTFQNNTLGIESPPKAQELSSSQNIASFQIKDLVHKSWKGNTLNILIKNSINFKGLQLRKVFSSKAPAPSENKS